MEIGLEELLMMSLTNINVFNEKDEGNVLFNDALNTFYLVIWCQIFFAF